jgi:hypothetical protein
VGQDTGYSFPDPGFRILDKGYSILKEVKRNAEGSTCVEREKTKEKKTKD